MQSRTIVINGALFAHSSLGHINRQLARGLARRGHRVFCLPSGVDDFTVRETPEWSDVAALIAEPPVACDLWISQRWMDCWTRPTQARAFVVYQGWEFGPMPKLWVDPMSTVCDEIWTYSRWCADWFSKGGVPQSRIAVVPLGVDSRFFAPDGPRADIATEKSFRFLFLGGAGARKGIDLLLEAFTQVFTRSDDVALVVKDSTWNCWQSADFRRNVASYIQSAKGPEIVYFHGNVLPQELPPIYRACDVYVHPFRGEGFGLTMLEAMSCARPLIATYAGPAKDFLSMDAGWLLPCQDVPIPQDWDIELETVQPPVWAEPDFGSLKMALREAFERRYALPAKGRAARQAALQWSWDKTLDAVEERLSYLSRPSTTSISFVSETIRPISDNSPDAIPTSPPSSTTLPDESADPFPLLAGLPTADPLEPILLPPDLLRPRCASPAARAEVPTRLRIVTFLWSETYLWTLAKLGFHLDVVCSRPKIGPEKGSWRPNIRPIPPNIRFVTLREARDTAMRNGYHACICHTVNDFLNTESWPTPVIQVFHHPAKYGLNYTGLDLEMALADLKDRLADTTIIYGSQLIADSFGFPGSVIPPGIDLFEFPCGSLDAGFGIRVQDNLVVSRRSFDDFRRIAQTDVPLRILGNNPQIIGSNQSASFESLKAEYARARFYLFTADVDLENGYSLAVLEAMASGIPVICTRHPGSPIKDKSNGFCSDDLGELRARAFHLLKDVGLARELGLAARETIRNSFSFGAFRESWRFHLRRAAMLSQNAIRPRESDSFGAAA